MVHRLTRPRRDHPPEIVVVVPGTRLASFCGQLTSATPANTTAMPTIWLTPNLSPRNHQPSTAAIAGFT